MPRALISVKLDWGTKSKAFILERATSFLALREMILDVFPEIFKDDLLRVYYKRSSFSREWVDISSDEQFTVFITAYKYSHLEMKLEVRRNQTGDVVGSSMATSSHRFGENFISSNGENLMDDLHFSKWLKNLECTDASQMVENPTNDIIESQKNDLEINSTVEESKVKPYSSYPSIVRPQHPHFWLTKDFS